MEMSMKTLRFVFPVAVLLFVAACGSSSSTPTTPTPSPTPNPSPTSGNLVTIPSGAQTLGNAAYKPNPIMVSAGATVTWTNDDGVTHTVTSDSGAFNSNGLASGGTFQFTFPTAGTFPYHCTIHPGMVGTVVVQ